MNSELLNAAPLVKRFPQNMHLEWDHDGEVWEPFSILGSITLLGDVGGEIHDNCLMLDSWLIGFAQGLIELRSGVSSASIDSIDQPNEIRLQKSGNGFRLSWMNQHAEVADIDLASSLLASRLQALASDLRRHDPPRDESAIRELERYADELAGKAWAENALPRRESGIEP